MRPETRRLLRQRGKVVWLTARPETILARMAADPTTPDRRPSLTGKTPLEEIVQLLAVRQAAYREAADLIGRHGSRAAGGPGGGHHWASWASGRPADLAPTFQQLAHFYLTPPASVVILRRPLVSCSYGSEGSRLKKTHNMRPARRELIALLAAVTTICGCTPTLSKGKLSLAPAQMSPDSVGLELFFVRCPFGDPDVNTKLWQEIDEQHLPADLRERLARNGFRAGVVSGQIPVELSKLLELGDKPASGASGPASGSDSQGAR